MRFWLVGLFFALGVAMGVQAQERDIEAVISRQLEAFEQDDFAEAFTFAAPNIRSIFRTPENFGTMVQRGYPMVWRPGEVTFLDLRQEAGRFVQTVRIADSDGVTHFLDYAMIQTADGWKISGVQLLKAPGVSA